MDIKEVDKLVKLVEKSGVSKLLLEENGVKLEIRKEQPVQEIVQQIPVVQQPAMPVSAVPIQAAPQTEGKIDSIIKESPKDDSLFEVASPMVGTYYESPAPGESAFINIGQQVKVGDTVGIVEAMKLFNEIEAEVSGTIESILVKNEDKVELGQTLCIIRKN
jgi:acetyl-CoA carboxylase biotin carboxyl carrier protein